MTSDAGLTWQSTGLSDYADILIDTHFFNENEGLVVGGKRDSASNRYRAVVLSTTDGGTSWTNRHTGSDLHEWGWKISFPSRSVGYVSIEHANVDYPPAKVLRTADGGLTWEEVLIPPVLELRGLQGVGFVSDSVGWAGGRGSTARTNSAGESWVGYDGIDGAVNRFRFFGDSLGFAVGEYVYKYTTTNTGVARQNMTRERIVEAVFPQPASASVLVRLQGAFEPDFSVEIYDVSGRRIADRSSGAIEIRTNEVVWDVRRPAMPPGVYFMRIASERSVVVVPIVVVDV